MNIFFMAITLIYVIMYLLYRVVLCVLYGTCIVIPVADSVGDQCVLQGNQWSESTKVRACSTYP